VNRTAAAGAALALIAVFVALAVSVVDARRPLDGRVSRSFDAAVSRGPGATTAVAPQGCVKTRVDFYRCSVEVRHRNGSSRTVYWMMLLGDGGCWSTYVRWPRVPNRSAAAKLGLPKGCTG
jgi:hypothetical protein